MNYLGLNRWFCSGDAGLLDWNATPAPFSVRSLCVGVAGRWPRWGCFFVSVFVVDCSSDDFRVSTKERRFCVEGSGFFFSGGLILSSFDTSGLTRQAAKFPVQIRIVIHPVSQKGEVGRLVGQCICNCFFLCFSLLVVECS